jgi:hypothetical protein
MHRPNRRGAREDPVTTAPPLCDWCVSPIPPEVYRPGCRFCSTKCRQSAHRIRKRGAGAVVTNGSRLTFRYDDPPYPGTAKKYYGDQPSYAGEVDHVALIADACARFASGELAGYALSTSGKALRTLLPLFPEGVRVCPWVKAIGVPPRSYGAHNTWEPLIVLGGRRKQPGFRDWLCAHPARGGGDLPGRKSLAFCAFLFQQLGLEPGDVLVDTFPGTGVVGRAFAEVSRRGLPAVCDAARSPSRR